MKYIRQVRTIPNLRYKEIHRDEVKYWFDVLSDNSISSIARETGYTLHFVSSTINNYLSK